jgi:hypothetical protein
MKKIYIIPIILLLTYCSSKEVIIKTPIEKPIDEPIVKHIEKPVEKQIEKTIEDFKMLFNKGELPFQIPNGSKIDSIIIDESTKNIRIVTNDRFSFRAFRENQITEIKSVVKSYFKSEYSDYQIQIYSIGFQIEKLIPNYYLVDKTKIDSSRIYNLKNIKQLVTNVDRGYEITNGLNGKHIALWHSHGWYYNHDFKRWMWQRARLFTAVEDLGPFTFTIPYIIPMLENAGANVFIPRERDVQRDEIVIDNNGSNEGFIKTTSDWIEFDSTGFAIGNPPYADNLNPFLQGSYLKTKADKNGNESVSYIPNFKKSGEYAVYISYNHSNKNITDAKYKVFHLGGITEFSVNQQIGGETWIYLGTFKFTQGQNENIGQVQITNNSNEDGFVTTDAIRFGGGMGIIEREGTTSERPKFVEGARYYLQYAGMPDTLVYNFNKNKDYNDDYQSRGEWVNYLLGNPFGPNKNRQTKGLGIPIDLSLAFHTDAGITKNDTVIGTLQIYSLFDAEKKPYFPNGVSRLANRDFSDIMQTQICDDIKAKYDSAWSKRQLMEADYSEAFRPNVPATLLELLSHQNLQDVKFMNDPQFRFDVSRSIYKSMLRFLSMQYNYDYVVQPLPVTHFSALLSKKGIVNLSWMPQEDKLEPTAKAKKYKIYTRIDNGGFDNGIIVSGNSTVINNIKPNKIYSYKVTAINEGGESFPSEILSVGWNGKSNEPVLIINGFDRISTAKVIESENFSGFVAAIDEGVPDKMDIGFVGDQHNFTPYSKWETDDVPGHGASYADMETTVFVGNTFDYPFIHGKAIIENGLSFSSASDESVEENRITINSFKMVDLIYGEEKETFWQTTFADSINGSRFKVFPTKMKQAISDYLNNGGNIFISGAYVGTDMFIDKNAESEDSKFCKDVLKYKLASDHAVKNGEVKFISNSLTKSEKIEFNTEYNEDIYRVEAPDAIGAINGSKTFLNYTENNYSAGVTFKDKYGSIVIGFPFETIKTELDRNDFMKYVIKYFGLK